MENIDPNIASTNQRASKRKLQEVFNDAEVMDSMMYDEIWSESEKSSKKVSKSQAKRGISKAAKIQKLSFTQLPDDIIRMLMQYCDLNFAYSKLPLLNSYHYKKSRRGEYISIVQNARIRLETTDIDSRAIASLASSLSGIRTLSGISLQSDSKMNVLGGTLLEVLNHTEMRQESMIKKVKSIELDFSQSDYY